MSAPTGARSSRPAGRYGAAMQPRAVAPLHDKRILFVGATGMVGEPLAKALATDNEVIGLARFSRPKARVRLEAAGVACVPFDLATGDYGALPDDVDLVANFAVAHGSDWDQVLAANVESLGLLMARYASAEAFLHCSSTAVYEPAGAAPRRESDPLGDNHRGFMDGYSIAKIAAEAVVRTAARSEGLATTIARLNVPYGDRCGFPYFHLEAMRRGTAIELNPERPNLFNPLHERDIAAMVPALVAVASVPATIVNWAGDETVSVEQWCAHLELLTGLEARFVENPVMVASVVPELTRLHELVGHAGVAWRDGLAQMVAAHGLAVADAPVG